MTSMKKEQVEQMAGRLYGVYSREVGGVSVSGQSLPTWAELRSDPRREHVVRGFLAVAREAAKATRQPGARRHPGA